MALIGRMDVGGRKYASPQSFGGVETGRKYASQTMALLGSNLTGQ